MGFATVHQWGFVHTGGPTEKGEIFALNGSIRSVTGQSFVDSNAPQICVHISSFALPLEGRNDVGAIEDNWQIGTTQVKLRLITGLAFWKGVQTSPVIITTSVWNSAEDSLRLHHRYMCPIRTIYKSATKLPVKFSLKNYTFQLIEGRLKGSLGSSLFFRDRRNPAATHPFISTRARRFE